MTKHNPSHVARQLLLRAGFPVPRAALVRSFPTAPTEGGLPNRADFENARGAETLIQPASPDRFYLTLGAICRMVIRSMQCFFLFFLWTSYFVRSFFSSFFFFSC